MTYQMLMTTSLIECPECYGHGTLTYTRFIRQGFDVDVGYEEEYKNTCFNCNGDCEIEIEPEDLDNDE